MTDSRPLGLVRLRRLPVGARIEDCHGCVWERQAEGWFRMSGRTVVASYMRLHESYRPLRLVP